ncbi:MAG: hypothetical protein ACJ74O_00015 [Frankiaceae bacterium]
MLSTIATVVVGAVLAVAGMLGIVAATSTDHSVQKPLVTYGQR